MYDRMDLEGKVQVNPSVVIGWAYEAQIDDFYRLGNLDNIFFDSILPPRVLDRRLQEDWTRAAKEGPRVLKNFRVDF